MLFFEFPFDTLMKNTFPQNPLIELRFEFDSVFTSLIGLTAEKRVQNNSINGSLIRHQAKI